MPHLFPYPCSAFVHVGPWLDAGSLSPATFTFFRVAISLQQLACYFHSSSHLLFGSCILCFTRLCLSHRIECHSRWDLQSWPRWLRLLWNTLQSLNCLSIPSFDRIHFLVAHARTTQFSVPMTVSLDSLAPPNQIPSSPSISSWSNRSLPCRTLL